MDDLINELYYGNPCPVEQMGRPTPGEREILKRIHENEEKLRTALDEQGKAILDAIKDDCLDVASSMGERRFREAFNLGARLMVEILMNQYLSIVVFIICLPSTQCIKI